MLTTDAVSNILNTAQNIQEISFAFCQNLTDEGFLSLKKDQDGNIHLPSLHLLNIRGCTNLTDRTLSFIASSCPSLFQLDISRSPFYTEKGLDLILHCCKKLQILNIREFQGRLEGPFENNPLQVSFLKRLNASKCLFSDDLFRFLSENGNLFRKLSLSETNVTASCLLPIMIAGAFPCLESLEIRGIPGISPKMIQSVLEIRKNLHIRIVHLPEPQSDYWQQLRILSSGIKRNTEKEGKVLKIQKENLEKEEKVEDVEE
jgi:hypothetical protein